MTREWEFAGTRGAVLAREWPSLSDPPRYVALLAHGYGEHLGRYEHVADALVRHGASVCGPDHMGHGLSAGERALIDDFEDVVRDLRTVFEAARNDHPGVPVVLIGHSMGGMIATRYAQHHAGDLAALVLSSPVLGRWQTVDDLLALDEIPDTPIDPATLSRDPRVGKAYAADPLVWHGPFRRPTLEALDRCMAAINAHGSLGALPTLYMHAGDDRLVPISGTRTGIDAVSGTDFTERIFPGAQHEIFNETNADEVLSEVTAFVDRVLSQQET